MTYPGRKRPLAPDEIPPEKPVPSVEDWFARNISGAGFWEWYVEQVDPDGQNKDILPTRKPGQNRPKVK